MIHRDSTAFHSLSGIFLLLGLLSANFAFTADPRPDRRDSKQSAHEHFLSFPLESPPDSPSESEAHHPSPQSYSDTECADTQNALNSFHKSMEEYIADLNRRTGNKYQFSPPPTPLSFTVDGPENDEIGELQLPSAQKSPPKEKPSSVSSTWRVIRALPYIVSFLLLQVIFISCMTTPAGLTMLGMLLSLAGMLLLPVLYIVNNVSLTDWLLRSVFSR
ncbi:Protein sprouty [Perkinsela sp. CCAP 1560/4]|nr:Protein sprouty [Perkinsela sp. CCAP 1560/4]|eukprot:KNH07417.1 Protein sprouty [Perkinsela sp. CCAP 1560/4]